LRDVITDWGFAQRALLREDDFGMIDKLLEAM
jgi:hypothetical protein